MMSPTPGGAPMDEQAAERRALADGTRLIRQEHDYGCGIASLAMCCGMTYEQVRTWLIGNWPKGSQTPDEWLTKRGIHKGIADYFLAGQGYVWRTVYSGWGQEPWPPEPFAPVHLAQVVQPSNNSHYVVMRADGVVLDPLSDEPKRLTDWEKVNNVQGVWPNPADRLAAAEERDQLRAEVERLRAKLNERHAPPTSEKLTKLHERAHQAKSSRPWRVVDWLVHHLDAAWAERDAAVSRAEAAEAAVEELRAGADETPMVEGMVPTPGQWVALFLKRDAEGRRNMAASAQQFADEAHVCWMELHRDVIGDQRRQIAELRASLAPQPAHDGPERPRGATNPVSEGSPDTEEGE